MLSLTFFSLPAAAVAACVWLSGCGFDSSNTASASAATAHQQAVVITNDCRSVDALSSQKGCRSHRTLVGSK
jgi:hypothetical protein